MKFNFHREQESNIIFCSSRLEFNYECQNECQAVPHVPDYCVAEVHLVN